jgi:hypothetical protein
MDKGRVNVKTQLSIATYEGDWTAEEIDAGLAGEPTRIDIVEDESEIDIASVTNPDMLRAIEAAQVAKE